MKTIILFTLICLNSFFFCSAQQTKWPYLEYSYAKAYMYNLESSLTGSYAIIQDGEITSSATSEGKILNASQANKTISLINGNIQGLIEGLSKTFIPHHAIVFFDKNDVPKAAIMFSFDGEAVRLQPELKGKKVIKELTAQEITDQLTKLTEFRKIIEDLDFPVLNSPFEYQELKPMKTRSIGMPTFKLNGPNSIKQLVSDDNKRFDLSGIVNFRDQILVIADKAWNKYIYQIDTLQHNFKISSFQQLCTNLELDIEGIDYYNNSFYIIEETQNEVYSIDIGKCEINKLEIPWLSYGIDRSNWGNKGFEGIAIDSVNHFLYLAKEREERHIYRIDLRTMEISEPFVNQLQIGGGHDIADLKYENGNLYLLERGLGQVTRINCKTGEKRSFSFKDLEYKNGQRMFTNENPQYGMAEALLLTSGEIWIGYDNNGDPVSDYGKSLGLKDGNMTTIIIFKRPKGF